MSLIAIGDIHGCRRTLDGLLERLALSLEDHVVFLGDYIDRGPDSAAVLDRMIEMERQARVGRGPRCTFIRGNHDEMMLDAVEQTDPGLARAQAAEAYALWQHNGGRITLESYESDGVMTIPEAHLDFLNRTELVAEVGEFVFVHAGMDPTRTVADNLDRCDPNVLLWTRAHLNADHLDLWERTVVCGHTPIAEPISLPRLIAIDTGAVFPHHAELGRLTAVRLPEREFVSLPYRE